VVLALGVAVALKLRSETLPSGSIARAVASWEQVVAENPEDSPTGLGLALLDAGRAAERRPLRGGTVAERGELGRDAVR
jgi:hypothetical protein